MISEDLTINTVFGTEEVQSKSCIYCKESLSISEFAKHSQKVDGYDTRCRNCIKKRKSIVDKIREGAPPQPKTCECCGKPPNKGTNINPRRRVMGLMLDHDSVTNTFRGWLCGDCNRAIGSLGDDIEGVEKALRYLKRGKNK